jgi:rhodanese-related sulfurtransferase
MRKMLFSIVILLLSGFIQTTLSAETASGPENVPRMTKEQLKAQLGNSDFVIIDVRSDHDWQDSNTKIKGAVRENPSKLDSWINNYPKDKTIVLYCAWVNEATSASVALQLMGRGYRKVYALKGGWTDWEKEKYPVQQKDVNK